MDYQLAPHVAPWPEDFNDWTEGFCDVSAPMDDGCYVRTWPGGGLRTLGRVENGRLVGWLGLTEDGLEGHLQERRSAQKYYRDGRMEDFDPWDDSSPAYPAEIPLRAWVEHVIEQLCAPVRSTPLVEDEDEPWFPESAPGPEVGLVHPAPGDLAACLEQLNDCRFYQVEDFCAFTGERFGWSPGLARDVLQLGCHACLWVGRPDDRVSETFLTPRWESDPVWEELPLDCLELYRELRALVPPQAPPRPHWVWVLRDLAPSRVGYEDKLPQPVIWSVPPEDACRFWVTQVCSAQLLRYEASHRGDFWGQIQATDVDAFLWDAALCGALMLASSASGAWFHDPGAGTWQRRSDLEARNRELAGLLESWNVPTPAGWLGWLQSRHPEARGLPQLLACLRDALPAMESLHRAFERRHLPLRVEARQYFLRGDPSPGTRVPPYRAVAERFFFSPSREAVLPAARLNALRHRVEIAGRQLAGGPSDLSLTAYLAEHGEFSQAQRDLLRSILGVSVEPGPGMVQMVAAMHWVVAGFTEGDPWLDQSPRGFFFPALFLSLRVLSAF